MLVVVQVGDTFVPRSPLSDRLTAIGVLIFYTLFAGVAFLVEVGGWTGIVRAREKLRAEGAERWRLKKKLESRRAYRNPAFAGASASSRLRRNKTRAGKLRSSEKWRTAHDCCCQLLHNLCTQ